MSNEYRVEIKVKNNNILKKIEDAGYKTIGEFCRRTNNPNWQSIIGEFVNMKRAPLNTRNQYHPVIEKMCEILICHPDELFSDTQLNTCLETNKRTLQVNEAEMRFMLESTIEPLLLEEQLHFDRLPEEINKVLDTLNGREKTMIEMNFGLNGYKEPLSYREIAKSFDITAARVTQIIAEALRKLRHPSRSDHLKNNYIEQNDLYC